MFKVIYDRFHARYETDFEFKNLEDAIDYSETHEDYGEMYMIAIVDEGNIIRHSHTTSDVGKEYKI